MAPDEAAALERGDVVVHRSDPKHRLEVVGSARHVDYIGLAVPVGGPDAFGVYRWLYLSAERLEVVPPCEVIPFPGAPARTP